MKMKLFFILILLLITTLILENGLSMSYTRLHIEFWSIGSFAIFVFYIFIEYFLMVKTKENFSKKLYLYPIGLIIILAILFIILLISGEQSGWGSLYALSAFIALTLVILMFFYPRLYIQNKFRNKCQSFWSRFFNFLNINNITIICTLGIINILLISIYIFDYKTHGVYLNISLTSNQLYWNKEAIRIKNPDLCKKLSTTEKQNICNRYFLANKIGKKLRELTNTSYMTAYFSSYPHINQEKISLTIKYYSINDKKEKVIELKNKIEKFASKSTSIEFDNTYYGEVKIIFTTTFVENQENTIYDFFIKEVNPIFGI